MNENGSTSKDFHSYCNNKGPTLSLIKTTKNRIFGGFTPLEWNKNKNYLTDESGKTFIFSLDLMKKYDMIDKERLAINCSQIYGPCFGARDFSSGKNMKNPPSSFKNS